LGLNLAEFNLADGRMTSSSLETVNYASFDGALTFAPLDGSSFYPDVAQVVLGTL
jgi:hypothetical protein